MEIDPSPNISENRYNPVLDGDFVHNDDITDSEMGTLNGFPVRYVTVDRDAVAHRNITEIHRSIALRKNREQKQARAADEFTEKLALTASA